MLLDLTVRPIQIVPDECPRSVIVRTCGTGVYVKGIVISPGEYSEKPVPPVAKFEKGSQTFLETRLPTRHPRIKRNLHHQLLGTEPPKKEILLDPLRVASAYRNVGSNKMATASLSIIIEHPKLKNGRRRCFVTVVEEGNPILSVVLRNYADDPGLFEAEKTPLQRLEKREAQPMNVWERLSADTDEE